MSSVLTHRYIALSLWTNEGYRLMKLVQHLQIGTLNVGTMTGRDLALADSMKTRKVDVLCVQQTRWKGNKAKELGEGVYAPQVGGTGEEKEQFWAALQEKLEKVDESERYIIVGDMNGHVGSGNDAISRIHGGNAYGNRDEDGEKVNDLAFSFDMVTGNTLFRNRNEHLITYKSGDRASQIDFLLYRRGNIREIKNWKVIPGDHVTAQHPLNVIDLIIAVSQKQKRKTTNQRRIK
ncbi:uncharacterized protein LOC119583331 [Penaeus monodon]|uniref:uncharacterized protein LOC119583331 n=1 Tax=Penaeus monodon TaxID=6687 RepID=UPI0018A7529D|nr:uncharacterized protein LOC119583331 [Penaeus monodon]